MEQTLVQKLFLDFFSLFFLRLIDTLTKIAFFHHRHIKTLKTRFNEFHTHFIDFLIFQMQITMTQAIKKIYSISHIQTTFYLSTSQNALLSTARVDVTMLENYKFPFNYLLTRLFVELKCCCGLIQFALAIIHFFIKEKSMPEVNIYTT